MPVGQEPIDGPSQEISYNEKSYKFNKYGLLTDGKAVNVESYCL